MAPQFDNRGLYPVENKIEMIRLRMELGLPSHDEDLIEECSDSNKANLYPTDHEFNIWRKRVGWI